MQHHISGQQVSHDAIELGSYWIDRAGRIYFVESCNHEATARLMGFAGAWEPEAMGWVHFSLFAMGYVVWNPRSRMVRPSQGQVDAIGAIEAHAMAVADATSPYDLSRLNAEKALNACASFWRLVNDD